MAREFAEEPTPKGEVVLLVGPPNANEGASAEATLDEKLREALLQYSLKDAATVVSQASGLPRRQVYARAIALNALDPAVPK